MAYAKPTLLIINNIMCAMKITGVINVGENKKTIENEVSKSKYEICSTLILQFCISIF